MFKTWIRLLPFFMVVKLAKKYCEKQPLYNETVVQPFNDVLILLETNKETKKRKIVFDTEKTEWKYQN